MSQESHKKRWTAYGFKLEKDSQGAKKPSSTSEHPLDIQEELHNINMGDLTKGPYGIPISTGVAVMLIKNMLDELSKNGFGYSKEGFNDAFRNSVIGKLLLNSLGVTFDKSQLLRIISQPQCEGVRFYHAIRKNDKGESESATLVCVGVDKNGYDLNYFDEVNQKYKVNKVDDTCESLVDDWGHPPTFAKSIDFIEDKIKNPRYVLWRLAEEL